MRFNEMYSVEIHHKRNFSVSQQYGADGKPLAGKIFSAEGGFLPSFRSIPPPSPPNNFTEEVRLAGQAARRYRPMNKEQYQALLKRGELLAKEWGKHLGEV